MKITKPFRIVTCYVLILAFFMCLMLGGCCFVTYPFEKASFWVCDDPHIEVDFTNANPNAYLEWDGEVIPIFIGLQADNFHVFRVVPGQDMLREEDLLFTGSWHYAGKKMVVKITRDRIFNGAYTRLIFVPQ